MNTSNDSARLAAGMMCVGFEGLSVQHTLGKLLDAGVGQVVLFARNVETPQQVSELCNEIRNRAPGPVLICVDQEGGRVRRFREGFSPVPSMRDVGRLGDVNVASEIGTMLGMELRCVGIDLNFAPVVDVDTNPLNPVIADRSFSSDPLVVSNMACAMISGMQSAGVAACAKHFPGHGDTSTDSHHALPRLDHGMERLRTIELPPFFAAAKAGVAAMMTSHVIFSPLDSTMPATLSPHVIKPILREEMRYDGLVFSDDMEMKAVANFFGFDESITAAAYASVDVLTVCHTLDRQWRAIEVLASLPDEILRAANLRRQRVVDRYVNLPRPGLDVLDSASHRQTIARVNRSKEDADPTERSKWM